MQAFKQCPAKESEKGTGFGAGGWGGERYQPILESKVWTNFRVLSTESSGFREWSTKFKNAFGQARPGHEGLTYTRVIEKLEILAGQWMSDPGRVEEQMRDQIDETKMNDVMEGLSLPDMTSDKWARICEDIYAVLLDKTEGELHRKVVNQ